MKAVSSVVAIGRYTPEDQVACLRVFDSNQGVSFAAEEKAAFNAFQLALPGPFWVARNESDEVVGCGGVSRASQGNVAWLRWGMVDSAFHRQGIGTSLLEKRVDWIVQHTSARQIRVATTIEALGFFLKRGFEPDRVLADYYGSGRDRHDLARQLPDRLSPSELERSAR